MRVSMIPLDIFETEVFIYTHSFKMYVYTFNLTHFEFRMYQSLRLSQYLNVP